ncbi:MAG: orange carotenoid protein N-terminal domain-containing protein [Cyanobacteria bacterium P01_D01_bin.6]
MTTANLNSQIDRSIDRFFNASAQTRLVILHYLAQRIHRASNSATPSAFFSQRVQTVIKQLQQLPREDRHSALEEILYGMPTRLAEAYGELDTNMRMAFWYRLANSRRNDSLLAHGALTSWNQEQHLLLADLETRDSNELITFLRDAVADEQPAAIA